MSEEVKHPHMVCASETYSVWASPHDLVSHDAGTYFDDPSEPRLMLVQRMAFIKGMNLYERCDKVCLCYVMTHVHYHVGIWFMVS
jgi:hypothetical protein